MTVEDEDDQEIAGKVVLRFSGSITTDAWNDYKNSWSQKETVRFDAYTPGHFGAVVGMHLAYIAGNLMFGGRVASEIEAAKGLRDSFVEKINEVIEREMLIKHAEDA